jgi:predicted N-acetyltransferase YhbS
MPLTLQPLFELPQHRAAMAALIDGEFWTGVPGTSVERMAQRLALADRPDRVPLCLVALHGGEPVGVVNLVDNDDAQHVEWTPWLAGLVVVPEWRGRGVGTALVTALLQQARALGCPRVYLGTDGPGFYARLGAVVQRQPRAGFWFLRFDLPGAGTAAASA